MEIKRFCQIQDHNQSITLLCVYKECQNDFRWVCKLCRQNKFHQHGLLDSKHLINKAQLIQLLNKQQTSFVELISQIQQDIFTITRQQMNRLIKFYNQDESKQQQIPKINQKQNQQFAKVQQQHQYNKAKKIYTNQNKYDFKYDLYHEKAINQEFPYQFDKIWISPNEKIFLLFDLRFCYIIDLRSKKQLCKTKLRHRPYSGFFSQDSKYFYMVTFNSKVFCFRVDHRFKMVNQLGNRTIGYSSRIVFMSPYIYLMMSDDKIMMNNVKINKLQNLSPLCSKSRITAFDYCQQQQTLLILYYKFVDGYETYKIKLVKVLSLKVIFEQNFITTNMIQMIQNSQFITTEKESYMSPRSVYLWYIDYAQKKVLLKNVFKSEYPIESFHFFTKMDKIFIYHEQSIQIINPDLGLVQRIRPIVGNESKWLVSNIKTSFNYIVVYGKCKILFLLQNSFSYSSLDNNFE